MKIFTKWAFWLPFLYSAYIGYAFLDAFSGASGSGEANLGAWMLIFALMPAITLVKTLGFHVQLGGVTSVFELTVLIAQGLILLAIGAAVDAAIRRAR